MIAIMISIKKKRIFSIRLNDLRNVSRESSIGSRIHAVYVLLYSLAFISTSGISFVSDCHCSKPLNHPILSVHLVSHRKAVAAEFY